jgi:enoyl-CoA hydratase/carnithine racemase
MVALSRNISRKHAMEMLLCGDMISAQRAEQIGLINRVVELDNMDEAVAAMAKQIADKSAMTVAMGKKAFYAQVEMDLVGAYSHSAAVMVDNLLKDDAREGIGAFFDKRKPEWSDK